MKKNFGIMKTASLLLVIVMLLLTLSSCGASKPSFEDASGAAGTLTWSYTKDNKTLTVSGVSEIPSYASAAEVPWNGIRTGVESVVVSDGVTAVGDYAFFGMTYLKSVTLPATVKTIGKCAFAFDSALEGVELKDGLTAIGDSAFEACTALRSITVPNSVTSLGARAFAFCTALANVAMVGNVTELKEETFFNCKNMEKLTLNPSVITIHETAFEGASRNEEQAERSELAVKVFTVTVTYVYEDGTEAKPTIREDKEDGAGYSYITESIEGYTHDVEHVQGTVSGANVDVKVTYTKIVEQPVEPEAPVVEEEQDEPVTFQMVLAIVILVLVLVGIGVGGFLLVRMDKKQAKGQGARGASKNNKKR